MANSYTNQFLFSKYGKLTLVSGGAQFGASGAVALSFGAGILSVTKLATGIYQVKLKDNFVAFVDSDYQMRSSVSAAGAVTGGAFVTGTLYQIQTLGTTTQAQWVAAGVDPDFTAKVGTPFVATAAGAGTGTVKAIAPSGIVQVEIVQTTSTMLNNLNSVQKKGSSFIVQTLAATSSSVTTLIPSDPLNGSTLGLKFWFRDSTALAL